MSLRVLLVDLQSGRVATLRAALEDSGFTVADVITSGDDLDDAVRRIQPDAVLVDTDSPSRDTLEHLATLEGFPKPTLMFSARDDPRALAMVAEVGVSAYVVEGLSPALVRSLVRAAVRQHEDVRALRDELDELRANAEGRKVIDCAKHMLMERTGMSEQDAYARLRKEAMNRSISMAELARAVLQRGAL